MDTVGTIFVGIIGLCVAGLAIAAVVSVSSILIPVAVVLAIGGVLKSIFS